MDHSGSPQRAGRLGDPARMAFRQIVVAARIAVLALCVGTGPAAADVESRREPVRVLIINSFGRENSPYDVFASAFRSELVRHVATPIAFFETSLDGARFDPAVDAAPFARFLADRFAGRPPDLVVPIGPLAARFYTEQRDELFPDTPMLVAAAEQRFLGEDALAPGDASVTLRLDIGLLLENILQLLPDTKRVVVVLGHSPIEQFWAGVTRAELARFEDRVSIEFLDALPLEEVEKRIGSLPPETAILFTQMFVDGAGISREHDSTLARLHAVANAPMFGLYDSQLGKGIVGGPLMPERTAAIHTAETARIQLADHEVPAAPAFEIVDLASPVYDARELRRWQIPQKRLPQASEIRFEPPSVWQQYRGTVIAAVVVLGLQSALLAGLLVQRSRRHSAEHEARQLSGRILTAHEEERRRLARELHDDVTPRLARLAIEAQRMRLQGGSSPDVDEAFPMHDELVRLSEDVHAFSYRLHSTVLDDLGLVDALRAECDRASEGQGLRVRFDPGTTPERLPGELASCLFRIAQEALRNVARHARASLVEVSLVRNDAGLRLRVTDDGIGFDAETSPRRPGLGLASMRARIRQVDGSVLIESEPGTGTTIVAWVPWPEGSP